MHTYLNCELSRWCKHDSCNFAIPKQMVFTQILSHRQGEGQSLAWACQVTGYYVFSVINGVKSVHLDWEQAFNTAFYQQLGWLCVDFREWLKLSIHNFVISQLLGWSHDTSKTDFLWTFRCCPGSILAFCLFFLVSASHRLFLNFFDFLDFWKMITGCKREILTSCLPFIIYLFASLEKGGNSFFLSASKFWRLSFGSELYFSWYLPEFSSGCSVWTPWGLLPVWAVGSPGVIILLTHLLQKLIMNLIN